MIGDNISIKNPRITEVTSLDPFRAKFDLVWESVRVTGMVDEMNGQIAYGTFPYLKRLCKDVCWTRLNVNRSRMSHANLFMVVWFFIFKQIWFAQQKVLTKGTWS